jgi:RNA polymerase sigma-70 factor (ECF subfamily)
MEDSKPKAPYRDCLAGLQRGDARAFEAVFEQYRPRLFAFLARMTGRRDVAEDLLQEVWLRLATHVSSLGPETDLGGWLFTVASNAARSHRRWAIVDLERIRQALFAGTSAPRSPFENLAATQAERSLERALTAVSVADREVLLLVGVEGLSAHQAAQVMGLKPEAVRQRLSRARARLLAQLDDPELFTHLQGAS